MPAVRRHRAHRRDRAVAFSGVTVAIGLGGMAIPLVSVLVSLITLQRPPGAATSAVVRQRC